MTWKRRLLLLALFLAVFAGAVAAAGYLMARGQPEWYVHQPMDPAVLEAAAARAEHQVQRTLGWAQDQQAFAASSARGTPTTNPSKSIDVSFTQDELNAFFKKWDSTFGWSNQYSPYVSDPQIALRDNHLLFAATVNDLGSVLTIEITPRLDDGQLHLSISRVLAGKLPLPTSFLTRYRTQVENLLASHVSEWRTRAEIGPQGGANSDAVAAAMADLLTDMLNDRPAPPVLFLPYSMQSRPKSLPVKVTDLRIENQTLTLTVEPLDPATRETLLHHLRTAPPDSPAPH